MNNAPTSSAFVQIKRQALEDQRQALLEEYQAASAQLARTLSDVDRVRLERQLRYLEQQIQQVEAALREIPPAPDALRTLFGALRDGCAEALATLADETAFVANFRVLFAGSGAGKDFEQLLDDWILLEPDGAGQSAYEAFWRLRAAYQVGELTRQFRQDALPIVQEWHSYFRKRYLGTTPVLPAGWHTTASSDGSSDQVLSQPAGASTGSNLTPSQRRHLEQEYSELQRRYDTLSRSIAALDTDISRTLEEYRKQPLEERCDERTAEREQVAGRMKEIELTLARTRPIEERSLADVLTVKLGRDGLHPFVEAGPGREWLRLKIEAAETIHGLYGQIYNIYRLAGEHDAIGVPLAESQTSFLSWDDDRFGAITLEPYQPRYLALAWHSSAHPRMPESQWRVSSSVAQGLRSVESPDWGLKQDFIPLKPGDHRFEVRFIALGFKPLMRAYRVLLHTDERARLQEQYLQESNDRGQQSYSATTQGAKATPGAQTQPDQFFGQGNRWAVLIGVNSYEDARHYGPLQVCVQDVEATREALLAGGFDPARIRLITDNTDEKPTRANILAALQSVASATERDDLLLVYYSGHGDAAGGEGYLVVRDGRHLVLGDTAVPVTRVKQIVERAPARAKVLLLDACHSGADIGQKGPRPMTPEFIQRVFEQAEGLAILSSCKQGQVSYEWRLRERSVFTHFLLEALAGAADRDGKGFVTVQDANRHVANAVKLWASQRNLSQTPTLQYSVAGDIILADSRQRAVKRET